ncbi:hypothetical protein AX774_g2751 [Zancudomyces culisetae]|uniref:Uncharacterized protein n=1 Tax=Zancudomyces culisetae TaxID=1213189 RepID=A0A1R1PRZ8_ZANCU|nr:hypothetical protein AX774_g2751 [Zancudomyces culisetae]|eukprot:OMH83737.1 hypothetical protein AX774_g2751 [Zancudomyces culisetae]
MVGARGRGGIDGFFGDGGCDPGDIDGPGDDIIGNFDSECLGYLFGSKVSELELLEAIEEFGPVEFKSKSRMELDPQYSLDRAIMDSEIDNLSYK